MNPVHTVRKIEAPLELVFQTISDARQFSTAIPHIVNIEFLTDQQVGVGTRFRETRVMNGRKEKVELEVTEFDINDRVRLVADSGGTIWDTVFIVSQKSDHVEMVMQMDIIPHTFFAKIMTRFIRGMVVKGVESDMDAVKSYCEAKKTNAT